MKNTHGKSVRFASTAPMERHRNVADVLKGGRLRPRRCGVLNVASSHTTCVCSFVYNSFFSVAVGSRHTSQRSGLCVLARFASDGFSWAEPSFSLSFMFACQHERSHTFNEGAAMGVLCYRLNLFRYKARRCLLVWLLLISRALLSAGRLL